MYFCILISLLPLFSVGWNYPVSAKFDLILTTRPPPTTPPPVAVKNTSNVNCHGFHVKFQNVGPYQLVIYNVPNLNLKFFDSSKFGTFDYGSMIDHDNGHIKAPFHGLYFIQVAIHLNFLSWNETESNEVTVAVCSSRCTSIASKKVWMYHTAKIEEGHMTLETSSILQLLKYQVLTVHLFFPNTFDVKIHSSSSVSGVLIKSFEV